MVLLYSSAAINIDEWNPLANMHSTLKIQFIYTNY